MNHDPLYPEVTSTPMPQSPVIGADDANNLMEAIERNTAKIVEKSNVIRAEYIRHLHEKNKALDEELASLREAFLQATRGGRVDGNEKD